MILQRHSNKAHSTSGKENRSKKRKVDFNESEYCKKSKMAINKKLQFSPDIDSYSGGRSVKTNLSNMDEYSDDTDMEESSSTFEMTRKKTIASKHERAYNKNYMNADKKCQQHPKCQTISSDKATEELGVNNGQEETDSLDYGAIFSEEWNAVSHSSMVVIFIANVYCTGAQISF